MQHPPGATGTDADGPAGGGDDRRDRAGAFVFATDGRLLSASAAGGETPPWASDVHDLADLAARFRQPDGMPLTLQGPARRIATPATGTGGRALLICEPLSSTDVAGASALVVLVLPFGAEGDPGTLIRVLGSVLAHEFRTPLTTIYGGAELLTGEHVSDATRVEAARAVLREATRLHDVIENLIVLVRSDFDPPSEREPVLVHRLLATLVEERRARQAGPTLELNVHGRVPPVLANEADVRQALRNILDHAVHNSPPGGRVTAEVSAVGDVVEVRISDDGPGRSADQAPSAFDLFSPCGREVGDPSGANLALVVARRLVERLGGAARAEASLGGESVVTLPAAT